MKVQYRGVVTDALGHNAERHTHIRESHEAAEMAAIRLGRAYGNRARIAVERRVLDADPDAIQHPVGEWVLA
jgi:hypothetical protein